MRGDCVDVYTNDSPSKLEGVPRRGEGVCEYTNETHSSGLKPTSPNLGEEYYEMMK